MSAWSCLSCSNRLIMMNIWLNVPPAESFIHHEIKKITLIDHFSKCQVHTYLQWDKSATVTFLWYVFSQNTYLFHRHCGRHSISRNRMSKVTQALRVGKDCPLLKATIKKKKISNSLSTQFSALPFYHKSKKASVFWSSILGISYNL